MASVWTVLLFVFVNSLKLGKYGLLFITVFLTFLKFCFIYIFIWVGYLFAFHMLLTQNPSFKTIWASVPRMVAMLTGEFNFENLFYLDGEPLRGTTMAKIIFMTFVFVVHICVMNILVRHEFARSINRQLTTMKFYFRYDWRSKSEHFRIDFSFVFVQF